MTNIDFFSLRRQVDELRRIKGENGEPASVSFLRKMILTCGDEEFHLIKHLLIVELSRFKLEDEELGILELSINKFPEEISAWVELANFHAFTKGCYKKAEEASEHAVYLARQQQRFFRYAMGACARIAKKFNDYSRLEACLRSLMQESYPTREDVGYEEDFIIALPAGAVDDDLLENYRKQKTQLT